MKQHSLAILMLSSICSRCLESAHRCVQPHNTGIMKCSSYLLSCPGVDPTEANCKCVREAAERGYQGIVKLLLECPGVNPMVAFEGAAKENQIKLLKFLLNRFTKGVKGLYGLHIATENGNLKIIDLLLSHPFKLIPSAEIISL